MPGFLAFLLNRIGTMLVTMLVISMLVFLIAEVVPIDPARNALGRYASQQKVDELRQKMGLDRPVAVRYVDWISNVLRGDFGESIHFRRPVADLVAVRLERSLTLAALGFAFMIPLGLALGCVAGVNEGKFLDRIISLSASLFVSVPPFASGVFLIVIFSLGLGWLPGVSIPDPDASFFETAKKLILPILALSFDEIGYLARFTRVSMAEVMDSDYIRTAVLKGIPRIKIIWWHALRNALIAPFTAIMLHVNWLIGGVVVVEVLFNYPGLGRLLLDAALRNDIILLEGGTLVLTFVAVSSQVIGDIGIYFMNPRIRLE
ncbi:MAG: ABC transporter permease [Pseudomonadales bacterium]|jgi:peptide/nickel transport system permease protein|nr:ABC transporter permease [Pseudomonadales bacterium]MDP7316001.1 ABC transporter permease [Pseudomonadales bacterium]|tara:strand:- start:1523 stop:2476 length:954 start_codon:yes stop_codon:yes gene_type:complete